MRFIRKTRARIVLYQLMRLNGHGRIEAAWNLLKAIYGGKAFYYPAKIRRKIRAERESVLQR
jgi:hypothetical protein